MSSVITLLQSGFTLVWTPYVYANYKNKPQEIDKLQDSLVAVLTLFTSLIIAFQYILVFIVGDKYREMTEYLPFLLLIPVFTSLSEITGIGINIAKKTKLHLINNITSVVVTFVLSILLVPSISGLGASLAAAVGSATLFLMRTLESLNFYMPVKNFKLIIFGITALLIMGTANCVFYGQKLILYPVFFVTLFIESIVLYQPIWGAIKYVKKGLMRK